MRLFRFQPALLVAPFALVLAPAADEVKFQPKADLELTKSLAISVEPELREVSLRMNGQDVGEAMAEAVGQNAVLELAIDVKDTYAKTKDGRILDLVREFEKIALHTDMGESSNDEDMLSKLGTKSVRFTWNEEDKKHARAFEGGSGDDKIIESLEADMDVTCLLPSKSVSVGDTWEVLGPNLGGLFLPGGMIDTSEEKGDGPDIDVEKAQELLRDAVAKFKVTCTYKGITEQDGVKLGAIELSFDDKAELDLGDFLRDALSEQMGEAEADLELRVSMALKGQGTLTWDMAAGHAHALDMSAEVTLNGSLSVEAENQGQSMNIEASFEAGGPATWKMSVK